MLLLPTTEWAPPVILGMQAGSGLLSADGCYGNFSGAEFRKAFAFYADFFRRKYAPVGQTKVINLYQSFAEGYFAMYITGPWNLGEFARRLPPQLQDAWATAPMPGPDGPASGVSLAGGSSLVVFRGSRRADAAWRLVEYLSRPAVQVRFFELTGDLPARREAWEMAGLSREPRVRAFWDQLQRVVPTPKVPEWEQIAFYRVQERVEQAVRGAVPPDSALARLDRDADRILEKRRWLLARRPEAGDAAGEAP